MWNKNTLTEKLKIEYPIIQGPFGGGLSTIELLSTVSNAGGMGSYGAHILTPAKIHDLITNIRKNTNKPFAINLWVSDHDKGGLGMTSDKFDQHLEHFKTFYDELNIEYPTYQQKYTERFEDQMQAVLDAAPPVFSFVFGIPSPDILEQCRKRGITTIGTATTLEEAIANEEAGVDIILATGFEAGGHRVSFLKSSEDSLVGTMALVPQIVERVKTPVIAAGGISNARGIRAALALGAEGVQMGTAFLACEESGTSDLHRKAIFSDDAKHTTLSRAFTGRLARFISNKYIREVEKNPDLPVPFPIQAFFSGPLKQAASKTENKDFASLYAGQGAPMLKYKNADKLITSLISEMNDPNF